MEDRSVREVMTEDVVTVVSTASVQEVARVLCDRRISGAPVLDESGHLVGVITETDLIAQVAGPHIPPHIELLGSVIYLERPREMQAHLRKAAGATAEEVMTRDVITVEDDCSLRDVAQVMMSHHIHFVPVMREGALVGIVSRRDLVATLR